MSADPRHIHLNAAQIVAAFLALLFAAWAVLVFDQRDTAASAALGFLSVISGFAVFWEQGMKHTKSTPDFDVTGPGDLH